MEGVHLDLKRPVRWYKKAIVKLSRVQTELKRAARCHEKVRKGLSGIEGDQTNDFGGINDA